MPEWGLFTVDAAALRERANPCQSVGPGGMQCGAPEELAGLRPGLLPVSL